MEENQIACNGLRLHVIMDGPGRGSPVILLHGFPEYWRGWVRQIPALAEAGFRTIVPDQRGYNLSDKPPGIHSYGARTLVADVIGLMDALGHGQVSLVGHDWGAAVAWCVALWHPERVRKLAVLNVPHPAVLLRFLARSPSQMARSWYIGLFQFPRLPEWLLKRDNYSALAGILQSTSRPGTFSREEIDLYRTAWAKPGAVTSMLHWYRALMRNRPPLPVPSRILVPTLLIWGARDVALGRGMAKPSIDLCDQGRLEVFEDATHWVQHEEAAAVNKLLLEFLAH